MNEECSHGGEDFDLIREMLYAEGERGTREKAEQYLKLAAPGEK